MLGALVLAVLAAEPMRCEVGTHIVGLSQINIADRAADVDLYWWSRCPKGSNPDQTALVLLSVTEMDLGETIREDFGDIAYQSQRIRARLKVPLSLKKYPFDHQRIVIDLESQVARRDLVYSLDPGDAPMKASPRCCLDTSVALPDWTIEKAEITLSPHEYQTAFGWPGEGDLKTFERLRVEVVAHREVLPYIIKYLLPLLIILAMAYARCFWGTDQLDSSTAVVSTALLAVVALHLAHATGLPEVGYLVRGDLFFIHAELVLVAMLAAVVFEYRLDKAGKSEVADRWAAWERRLLPPLVLVGWGAIILSA